MQNKILPIVIAALLGGCSLTPEYQTPAVPETDGWVGVEQVSNQEVLPEWRQFMADETLQEFVELALVNNKDLRQTVLNVASMRAQYRITDAERYPAINAGASQSRTFTQDAVTGNGDSYSSSYLATLGVTSYELDLFGKVKSNSNQALETYLSAEDSRRSAVISLVAEIASNYVSLLTNQELLAISQETVATYQETLKLVQTRFDAGYSDALTLAQSKTAVYGAQATVSGYQLAVATDFNTLRQLVGVPISMPETKRLPRNDGKMLFALKEGAPSELLLSRPDIMAAEHQLKADNANIGVARAAFFPSISLTASAGSASSSLDNLFSSNSGYWTFAPSLSLPIFNWGSNEATLDSAKIAKQVSVVAYQETIETAFKEVSDAVLGQHYYLSQWKSQQKNLEANMDYYELAKMRYEKGNDSYIDLLDAQRSLFSARESELSAHLNLLTSRVSLYKAMGGGWQAADIDSVNPKLVSESITEAD
ncbi:efflux transporter outer membrane subunit [Vibrio sp. RC27]